MATNFKVWIDTPDSTSTNANIETAQAFASDAQRIAGWIAGNTISSKKMNSILRQSSLVTSALMEAFCGSNTTLSLTSSLADVKSALENAIATKASVTSLSTSLSSLSSSVSSLSGSVTAMQNTINGLTNGTTTAGNAAKLGGNLPAYYQKAILTGTSAPSASLGVNGDIYIQYN